LTTTTTSKPESESYGAPFAEPEGLPKYQESPASTNEPKYKPPSTTLKPVITEGYLQPTYEKYKMPLTLPTFYSPPEPTSQRTPVPSSSTGTTYVAPFTESDLTKQDESKYLAPASYGSPPAYTSTYKPIVTSTSSIDSYGAPKAAPESTYQAPKPSQYITTVKPASSDENKSLDTYGSAQAKPEEAGPQYYAPSQAQYPPIKPSADIDTYGSPQASPESTPAPNQYFAPSQPDYTPEKPNPSIDSYGSPQAKATPAPSQYSPPSQSQYLPPTPNESLDTYGSPQSIPETTQPPPTPPKTESAGNDYGAPTDKPKDNPTYQPPPLPLYNQPVQTQYSSPTEETSSPATDNKDSYLAPQSQPENQTKPSGLTKDIKLICSS
jgi:hypothetical protein